MADVKMPNGDVVRFPDDMPPEQIKSLIASKFPDAANQAATAPVAQAPAQENYRGTILPFEKDAKTGDISLAMPKLLQGVLDSGTAALTAPYRAMTGELPMTDDAGRTSPEAISEAFNMAGWVTPPSMALGTGQNIARNQAIKDMAQPSNQVLQSAERIGVDIPKASATDSRIAQSAGKALENQPLVGSPLLKAGEKAKEQLGDAAKRVQDQYGKGDVPGAGALVRGDITTHAKSTLKDAVSKKYDAVDGLVTQNVTTPLAKTAEYVIGRKAERANAKIRGESSALLEVEDALNTPGGLNYKGIKDLRNNIGDMLDSPSLEQSGPAQKELTALYAGLSEDLRSAVARSGGPKALAEFEKANSFARKVAGERETLQKVLGTNKSDEAIFDGIEKMAGTNSRADLQKLFQVRKAVSKETWDEVASAVISRMGRDNEGNFSWDRFVTARNKLTPTGKAVLFNTTGKKELSKAIDDIETVSRRFSEIGKKYGNPSGTARNTGYVAAGAGLIASPVSAISTIVGGNLLARHLAKPETAITVANYVKAYEAALLLPGNATQMALERRARDLAIISANEMGNPALANGLFTKLSAIQKGATNEDNNDPNGHPITEPEANPERQQFNKAYLQGDAA